MTKLGEIGCGATFSVLSASPDNEVFALPAEAGFEAESRRFLLVFCLFGVGDAVGCGAIRKISRY